MRTLQRDGCPTAPRSVRERAQRADLTDFDRILAKAGSAPPWPGDEMPEERAGR